MSARQIVIVGAGPAGMEAALTLVKAGVRPIVVDAGARSGGQIYRRPPLAHKRDDKAVYGADAPKARRLHTAFDRILDQIDYRPRTRVWAARTGELFLDGPRGREVLPYDKLILCTGATDRVFPIPGWEVPGCYTLGGAQIALKSQALALGDPIGFVGAGPLLWLVAWQHLKAGARIAGVWCTAAPTGLLLALPFLALRPRLALRGARQIIELRLAGIPVYFGAQPHAVLAKGNDQVTGLRWSRGRKIHETALRAVALGWHLRSETQLPQLLGLPSEFDPVQNQHHPSVNWDGRSPVPGLYLAGDGADILGADAAVVRGRHAARSLLSDLGFRQTVMDRLKRMAGWLQYWRLKAFAKGLALAFPTPPAEQLKALPDRTVVCRCENVALRDVLAVSTEWNSKDINRIKSLTRAGMGRCQGRYCSAALSAILAARTGQPQAEVPEHRAQAPVYPLPLDAGKRSQSTP